MDSKKTVNCTNSVSRDIVEGVLQKNVISMRAKVRELNKWLLAVIHNELKILKVVKEKKEMIGIEKVGKALNEVVSAAVALDEAKEQSKKATIPMFKKISNREVEELTARIEAMSPEELAVVANTIPVELCLARLQKEMDRLKALDNSIQALADNLNK